MEEAKPEGFIKGSYTISLDIAGRRVQIGGYIQTDDDKASIITKMTEAQECIDYQLVRADTSSHEGKLKGEMAQLESLLEEHEKLLKKQDGLQGKRRLHATEEAKLRTFEPTMDQLKISIDYRKKIIAENKKVLSGANGAA